MSADYSTTKPEQWAWLFRVKKLASALEAKPFTGKRFESNLGVLHALTTSEQEIRKVPAVLADMGIRFVIVQHLPKTRIDGAVLWLDKKTPVIALSLRYDRIDGFWHTLIHEVMHVKHGDGNMSIDNALVGSDRESLETEQELVVDREAGSFLIPDDTLRSFIARVRPRYSKRRIIQFANLHQIHPGIVVGQLQHRGEIKYSHSREMLVSVRNILTETALTDGWGHIPTI